MRKYNPINSKVDIDESGKVTFTTQSIQEARITIHNAMFNFMNKEIKQLMKKHDAYVNKGGSDKTYTTISTPSPDFDKDYTALMKKNKKKIIQHFKIESVEEEVQEEGPCWPGYKQVGTKMKNGKEVPNCVPIDEEDVKENKMLAGDADYKVVELKNGMIRLEFVNVRDGDILMKKNDFKKLQKFISKVRV